jgi:hypothetical protein
MRRQRLIACTLVAAIASIGFGAAALGEARAAEMVAQTSSRGGVNITVEPPGFTRGAATWDFTVTLETHIQPLDDDLVTAATLLADGKPSRPLGWEGAPPGGHHRKGVLRFDAVTPLPQAVELQIRRTGEASPRVFRWQPGQLP